MAPYLENNVSLVSPMYRGLLRSGRNVWLSGNGYVDVPINAQLSAEMVSNYSLFLQGDEISAISNTTPNSFDLNVTVAGTNTVRPFVRYSSSTNNIGDVGILTFDVVVNSGNPILTYTTFAGLGSNRNISLQTGHYEFINYQVGINTGGLADLLFDGTKLFDISITNLSVKILSQPLGQVTYYDFTQKKHISPMLSLDTKYRLENVTFNNLIVLWDRNFTQADRDMMDANPELIASWALGNDVGFSIGFIGVNDKVYIGSDTDAFLRSMQNTQLAINGTYTRNNQVNDGTQTLSMKLDVNGVPTALANPNTLSYTNNSSGYTDTQWRPDSDTWSIEWTGAGLLEDLDANGNSLGTKSNRRETRLLTHDLLNGDKYYINTVLQTYVPALPNPLQSIKLNNIAPIGFPDVVDEIDNPFRVSSVVEVP